MKNETEQTWACDVYCKYPLDPAFQERATAEAAKHGGWLDYVETPQRPGDGQRTCLTYDFPDDAEADAGTAALTALGDCHVEGPYPYG